MSDFSLHVFSYDMDGSSWSITVIATSEAEARSRLARAAVGRFDGDNAQEVPAYLPGAGLYVRVVTWLRNALRR
jgi:hypothetical protein